MSKKEKIIIISLCTSFVVLLILFLIPFRIKSSYKTVGLFNSRNQIIDNGEFSYIIAKSNYGKEIEIVDCAKKQDNPCLVIPSSIDGIRVGILDLNQFINFFGYGRLYIPKGVKIINFPQNYSSLPAFILQEPCVFPITTHGDHFYSLPKDITIKDLSDLPTEDSMYTYCNVIYTTNIDDEIYYIDSFSNNFPIYHVPTDPIRYGYIFKGWYKEKECINKWDFENDLVIKGDEYKPIILYAKWEVE